MPPKLHLISIQQQVPWHPGEMEEETSATIRDVARTD